MARPGYDRPDKYDKLNELISLYKELIKNEKFSEKEIQEKIDEEVSEHRLEKEKQNHVSIGDDQ